MPRYFFDVLDGSFMQDATGAECANIGEARALASRFAGELLINAPDRLWRDLDWTVSVRDGLGLQLFSVVIFCSSSPAATAPKPDERR